MRPEESVADSGAHNAAWEPPQALKDHLQEQQTRAAELLSLLERLDEDAEQMYTHIAVREAQALEGALDIVTLSKVLRGEQGAGS